MPDIGLSSWGPRAWHTLHTIAHTSPDAIDDRQRKEYVAFLVLFAKFLPCPSCSLHFREFLTRRLSKTQFRTRDELVALLNDAHNEVNARNGRRIFTLEEHCRAYSLNQPRASSNVVVFAFVALLLIYGVRRRRQKIMTTT